MRRILLFAVLSVVTTILWGQNVIRGIVIDSLTREPLPSATVYINGTTQGTTTDNEGRFELKEVSFPATVVFSFVGYQPKALDLDRNPGKLTIELSTNDVLPEIVVSGKKNRIDQVYLDYFKTMFLGDDKWGKRATIKNENVLMFDKSYETSYQIRQIGRVRIANPNQYASDEIRERHERYLDTVKVVTSVFTAWAYEPVIIDMPLLGYEIYVDLVKFTAEQVNNVTSCNILGYFYYKPYDNVSKRKAKSIEDNRKRAYWGSSQHFLRSFAQNRLEENGYILTVPETIMKGKKAISTQMVVDVNKYSTSLSDNLMQISGLKDKKLRIRYYHRNDDFPLNLKEKGIGIHHYSESGMNVLEDKCIFRKEGIVIDNNIRFTGELSKKRVGASLPDDYFPLADTGKIEVKDSVDYASELMRFADNIQEFNNMFPQEKVYLEFDNTAYFQGENIWYKAFVSEASKLERAPSGVLYVDFLAPTGKLLLQQKLKIVAGQADGVIPLLDAGTQQTREKRGIVAYPSGFYEIRAYTQNMLNFTPEAVFSRVIPVYTQPKHIGEYNLSHVVTNQDNPLVEKLRGVSKEQKEQDNEVNVTFYPEGGDLIRGLPGKVAFKATGSDGFGIDGSLVVSGIHDSVRTVHDGMGSFIITSPENYASMRFYPLEGGKGQFYYFDTKKSGYSMISDMLSDSRLQVNIWRTEDRVGEQTALAVTCRGEVVHFEEIKDIENSQLEIDCSNWPIGVCRMTLFDKEGRILSSRSIFHNKGELNSPTITLNTDSMSHQSCDKEVIEFKLTDQDGNPFRDRFCLSVRDATDYGGGQTDNLQTNLLLSSDLRGYIHDPAWYLEANDEEHREALNLLTLVQGWERYEWQTMTGQKEFEEKHRVEEGLTVNGWILSYRKRKPLPDISIYSALMPDDDKTLFESFDYQTDSTGYFGFDLTDFYGRGNFTIHLMSTKNNGDSKYEKSKRIRFERADRPEPRPYLKQETDLDHNTSQVEDYNVDYTDYDLTPAQRRKLGRMIDDVDIEEEAGKLRFIDYDTFTSFEAEEDAELELDQGEYTTDPEGYLLEKGIRIFFKGPYGNTFEFISQDEGRKTTFFFWEDEDSYTFRAHFYVHNMWELADLDLNDILRLDMIHVKSIIIYDNPMTLREMSSLTPLENRYHDTHIDTEWSQRVATDINKYYLIDILVKEDWQMLQNWEIRNLSRRTTTVKGFNKPVQFYSPEYPDGPIEGNVDARRTLYWNPNVITDNEGHARVEFYNNSFTRRFTISAAGITASGIPYVLNQVW